MSRRRAAHQNNRRESYCGPSGFGLTPFRSPLRFARSPQTPLIQRPPAPPAPLEVRDEILERIRRQVGPTDNRHWRRYAARAGSTASMSLRRGSYWGGSFRDLPSEETGSSIAKPGMSVAISNSTPPGSRK
jgi:hypothetical protein